MTEIKAKTPRQQRRSKGNRLLRKQARKVISATVAANRAKNVLARELKAAKP